MPSLRLLIPAALLCYASAAIADLHIEYTTTSETTVEGKTTKTEQVSRQWFKADRAATEDDDCRSVTRFDKQVLWHIEKDGTYSEQSFDMMRKEIEKAGMEMAEANKKMEEALKDPKLPADAKESMTRSMAGRTIPHTLEKVGTEKVGDHECTHWVVKAGNNKAMEVWACETLDPMVDADKLADLTSSGANPVQDALKGVKGVWLKWSIESADPQMGMKQVTVATKVSTEAVADAVFDLPAGAKKVEEAHEAKKDEAKKD